MIRPIRRSESSEGSGNLIEPGWALYRVGSRPPRERSPCGDSSVTLAHPAWSRLPVQPQQNGDGCPVRFKGSAVELSDDGRDVRGSESVDHACRQETGDTDGFSSLVDG